MLEVPLLVQAGGTGNTTNVIPTSAGASIGGSTLTDQLSYKDGN